MHYHVRFAALQLAALLFCADSQRDCRVDLTLEEGATGDHVVIATVNKISESGIFQDDFQFLRRMAYVETNFGETATPGSGGIWNVSENVFRIVTRIIVLSQRKPYGELFESYFGFKWNETVVIDDCLVDNICNRQKLDVPLYSALSVMVYIDVLGHIIQDSIIQQAELWNRLFRSDSPDNEARVFIEKADILLNPLPTPSCTYPEGEVTVIVTVNKIAGSGIFPNDFQFLKRMAYIETNYGQTVTPGDGGIWAISMDMLRITTRYVLYHPQGQQLGKKIVGAFNFNWTATVVVDDCDAVCNRTQMDVPLYSALAVMIYIRILDRTIQDNVPQQSLLWKRAFKSSDTNEAYFSDKVEEMMRAGANKGVDMIFVMDESGSIGAANFELLKGLALQIIETFEIGPNLTQVGWINFNDNARVVFNLNTYQDIISLQAGIRAVTYSGGLTNISTGLLALNNILSTGGRSRLDIPEVAIVVIASQSDIEPIRNAAALLRRERNVEVVVIGVGSAIGLQQLNAVAEAGIARDNIFTLEGFNEEELDCLQDTLRAGACFSSIFSEVSFELNVTSLLPEGAKAYVNTVCPEDGLTINACSEDGAILVFISRNPKPVISISTHDVVIQIDEGECVSTFIECVEQRH